MKAEAEDVLRDQRKRARYRGRQRPKGRTEDEERRDEDEDDEDDNNNRTNFIRIKGREGGRTNFIRNFTPSRGFIRACGLFGSLPAGELALRVPLHAFLLSFLGSYSATSTPLFTSSIFLPTRRGPCAVKRESPLSPSRPSGSSKAGKGWQRMSSQRGGCVGRRKGRIVNRLKG